MSTSVLRTLAVRLRMNSAQFRKDINTVDRRMKKFANGMRRNANMFNSQLGQLGATLATGFGLGELSDAADVMVNLRNKMNATYDSTQEVSQGMVDIKRIARESRADLEAVGTLYQRITVSTKNLGATQEEVAAVTQVVTNSFLMSGTTASEAANSARQFAQGLASGALKGDEFRSVSENNVVLTKMLSDGFQMTVGELKEFAALGGITAERILPILKTQLEFTNEEVAKMRFSIQQARVLFKNSFTEMVDRLNSVYQVTTKVANVIKMFGDNIHIVTGALAVFATMLITKVIAGMVAWVALTTVGAITGTIGFMTSILSLGWAMGTYLVGAIAMAVKGFVRLGIAMLANPIGLVVAGITALIVGFVALEQKFKIVERISTSFKGMGEIANAVFGSIKIGFQKAILHSDIFFAKARNAIHNVLKKIGADSLANSVGTADVSTLEGQLSTLEKQARDAKARITKTLSDFQTPVDVETSGNGAFGGIIENIKGTFAGLIGANGEDGEGGMFAGMIEQFSLGVDGILQKMIESNPAIAKFWATVKGANDPDAALAGAAQGKDMEEMTWSEKWIESINRIKEAFKDMGASSRQTVKGMIERYDTFEEVLNKGIKNLKKNSHVRKGIMMKEAMMEGKAAILKAWNSAPFPANLPGVAITTASTALVMRDIMKGQAHDGMDSLPSTGTYMLEKGERVVSSRINKDLTEYLTTAKSGASAPQNLTLQVNGISDPDLVVNALSQRRNELEAMVRSVAQENLRISPL